MCSDFSLKTKDTISLNCSSLCYIASRNGWVSMKGIYKYSSIDDDVDVILEIVTLHLFRIGWVSTKGIYKL